MSETEAQADFNCAEEDWFLEDPTRFDVYEHRPIPIDEWIESPFGANINHIIRPRVKEILCRVFNQPNEFQEVVVNGGIGIGKSFLSATAVAYMLHRLLCLRNPRAFFQLAPGKPIAIMNCSVNALQARKVVFSEMTGAVKNSPWFQRYGYLPDDKIQSELKFKKDIEIIPGNSKELFFVGFDLYAGVIDEAAWHMVTDEKDYAEEAYNQMINRIKSRFGDYGKLFMISSPRYTDDFIERKMKESVDNAKIYAERVPYWECPPLTMKLSGETFDFDSSKRLII